MRIKTLSQILCLLVFTSDSIRLNYRNCCCIEYCVYEQIFITYCVLCAKIMYFCVGLIRTVALTVALEWEK